MKYDLVAFDFDGTLANTLPWFESIMDEVAEKYGFRKANAEERAQLRYRSAHEILAFLGVPIWKLPSIMAHVRRKMHDVAPDVRLFDGIPEALTQLRAAGLRMTVLSSNSQANVQRVLGPQASSWFDDYECGTDMFGKASKLRRLLARYRLAPQRCLLVGDEMRDIDAARKAGVNVASVAWGYNHVDALRAHGPDELILTVADLPARLI
ncbi:HAD-IA family hydrolase [Bordetella sp. 02P26C-1]|uniref:HAD-IA family hydrolase n=1 Tax=unclassified Bordetella TaxID=2630031 RepID=UPI001329418E|nr:HAD-IA family hydrolase [Bordetella sp. 15P40C-2]MVW79354.1 HAD-IA family hydrolase [Bordetella sp. 02P26C-1]